MARFRYFNVKGDLFATGATFAGQALIRLISSLILTRILTPVAYGTIAILMSIVHIFVMLSDVGFEICIVRSPNGDRQSYLNTAWTIRLVRGFLNAGLVYLLSPEIAALYHAPSLTAPLQVISLWFLIDSIESTAFPLATRRQNARILMYSEAFGTLIATIFTISYCYYSRNFWGMIYGTLAGRLTVVALSHCFYREHRPRLQWDRAAAKEVFQLSRYIAPSSALTLIRNQYDRAVFLRMFSLDLLGVYSLAGSISTPVENLISKASKMVLYPRCAHNFRTDRENFAKRYYHDNLKLFIVILAIPAAIGGAAHFLISLLYDPRYIMAAAVLRAFMVHATLTALSTPAEDMLVATGESRLILIGNVHRVIFMVIASYIGYRFFGFLGFVYGIAFSALPPLLYYLWLQTKKGVLIAKYEACKVAFVCVVAFSAYLTSNLLHLLMPAFRLRFH